MRFAVPCIIAMLVSVTAPAFSYAADALLFRVFLRDGGSVITYGEFARVGEQVILSVPVGGTPAEPRLQAVSLAASNVDWPKTDRYAASARYQQYVSTRAEADYQQLTEEVASVLSNIAQSTDRSRAVSLAEQARRMLMQWPQSHYGYRQQDVQEIVGVLDAAMTRLQGGAAPQPFQLSLVSTAETAGEPLAAMPTPREQLDQLLRIVRVTTDSSERVALLRTALTLAVTPGVVAAPEARQMRRSLVNEVERERTIDQRYARLADNMLTRAAKSAADARIADVQRVLDRIPQEDAKLGHQRPDVVQALTQSVQSRLEGARTLRLLRDQWRSRQAIFQEYQRSVGTELGVLVKSRAALEAIKKLDGPSPDRLETLHNRLRGGAARLDRLLVPEYLRSAHELLVSAWRFAETAAAGRLKAISTGEIGTAWEASSAAAGALMTLSRAQKEIRTIVEPPKLQ